MRLVLDTNVAAAGLLWEGPPNRLLQQAFDGIVELVTSAALLDELEGILARKKFANRLSRQPLSAMAYPTRMRNSVALAMGRTSFFSLRISTTP